MGMTRAQLTAIAKRTGYPVKAAWVPGHGPMGDVLGVMLHHTATPASAAGDYPSLKVVTQGRRDLPGPLCNFGLGRSGAIYLVSEGRAYHAGPGYWLGVTAGNTHFLGIEAENPGTGAPWPAVQLDAYRRLAASILHAIGRDTSWEIRHATWAHPPGRKIDTAGFDMSRFDAAVGRMLADPRTINRNYRPGTVKPAPAPTPPPPPPAPRKEFLVTTYVYGEKTDISIATVIGREHGWPQLFSAAHARKAADEGNRVLVIGRYAVEALKLDVPQGQTETVGRFVVANGTNYANSHARAVAAARAVGT